MSQINIRNLCNENEDGAPTIVGVSTFSATSYMCPPKGTTAQRPENPVSGSLRFNTDTASLEYYKGNTIGWTQIEMTSPDLGGGTGSNTGVGVRGLFGGGRSPTDFTHIEYITMATLGNGQDFGDLTQSGMDGDVGAVSNSTRVVFGGGTSDELGYVEIATLGNTTEFGKFTVQTTANQDPGCFSNGHGGLG